MNVGALPQLVTTIDEISLNRDIKLFIKLTKEKYEQLGKYFYSPIFSFIMKNLMIKRRKYCYVGKWGGSINLATGDFRL